MPLDSRGSNRVVLVIVLILAAIAVPALLASRRATLDQRCVANLVAAKNGTQGLACPACGQPYPPGDTLRCPDPKHHLAADPHFVRHETAWEFQQALPPFSGAVGVTLGSPQLYGEIALSATAVTLTVKPRLWWRLFVGPLLQIAALALLVALGRVLVKELRAPKRSPGVIVMLLVFAGTVGLPAWLCIASSWGRQTYEFDRARRTVTSRAYVAGAELSSPTIYADVEALTVVKRAAFSVIVVTRTADDGPKVTKLFALDEPSLGAVTPMHDALFHRP